MTTRPPIFLYYMNIQHKVHTHSTQAWERIDLVDTSYMDGKNNKIRKTNRWNYI